MMNVTSMTGFGRAAGSDAGASWTWEIKSVNGRTLDIRLKLPSSLERLETTARKALGQACQRGNIQVSLVFASSAATTGIRINEPLLETLHDQLAALARRRGLPPPALEALLTIRGVIKTEDGVAEAEDEAVTEARLMTSFDQAVAMLVETRKGEGGALATVLSEQLDRMVAGIGTAAAAASTQSEALRQRLQDQVRNLMDADQRLEPQRLHQEAVLLASRADIREELDRFSAHVEAARALLVAGGAVGRRLDFLAQELFRETNTICSKSASLDLTAVGLDLKSVVEQFREQVQDVE